MYAKVAVADQSTLWGLEYSIMALVCGFRGFAVSSDHAAIWYSLVIPCGIARLRT